LDKFQPGYDKKSRRIDTPEPVPVILTPPQLARSVSQKSTVTGTGTPAMAPPSRPVITEDDPKNQGLALICWKTPAQEMGRPQESAEAEPSSTDKEAPKTQEPASEIPATEDPAKEAES